MGPMEDLQPGGIVNVVTLIIFFIYLCLALYLILRQGLGRSSPWIWITILCVCRLTQVAIDLAATQMYEPETATNTSLESGVAILTSMGLTPLFMCTSSLLNSTTRPKGRRMQWILLMVHIPLVISFILIVAGGIDPDSRDGPTFAATESTKAGVSLYLACFVVLVWSTAIISARLYLADSDEVKILTTVVISLPFFVVDVVYMMCFAFEKWDWCEDEEGPCEAWRHMKFNVISGSVVLQSCMYVSYFPSCSSPQEAPILFPVNYSNEIMLHRVLNSWFIGRLFLSISLLDCTLALGSNYPVKLHA